MGRGFGQIREIVSEQAQRRAQQSSSGVYVTRFRIADGQSATVRFLEQGDDVTWAWGCQLPPKPSRQWGDWVPSLDQKKDGSTRCPMIERGYAPVFRGFINLIWRDAPLYERDANNRVVRDANGNFVQVGTKDQLFVWESGIKVFTMLEHIDTTYRGLMSRDFKVTRRGSRLATTYSVDPADPDGGPQPLSKHDLELLAQRHDLVKLVTPPSYEDLEKLLTEVEGTGPVTSDTSPFMRDRGENNTDGETNLFMS
jgi:hypothetical protein